MHVVYMVENIMDQFAHIKLLRQERREVLETNNYRQNHRDSYYHPGMAWW